MNEIEPCPQCGGITAHAVNCPWWRPQNSVHSKDFESKIDDFFTSKTKDKDHGTRAASIKIGGKWT